MKQSKHKMIDLYFQSSPPLTLVMDFFIYQQLSLSFNICPEQPILRFKCCVKQIHALMFFCRLQLMFCSCSRSRTDPRCANCVSRASLVVLWAIPNTELGMQPGAAPASRDVSHGMSQQPRPLLGFSSICRHCWASGSKCRSPILCAPIHFLSIVDPCFLGYCMCGWSYRNY